MQKGAQETHNCFAILEHKPDHKLQKPAQEKAQN